MLIVRLVIGGLIFVGVMGAITEWLGERERKKILKEAAEREANNPKKKKKIRTATEFRSGEQIH